ncbi:response regulator [Paenibacillus sp. GCM10012307]|uniref:Response regulator transcription factor n=1 Tax=Paenibacillus roseus TaxID=2798579 RepID=A0A934MMQ6_9BACL|nr:response regulator transcription factor [Paenibacillus roseus]MBJ6363610.1 response regulator transcription factor [Paenibacillus roseus]
MKETHILVVDDEPEITELIGLYLAREGFTVHVADNGNDALRLEQEVKPDLMILDILLKHMDGIEVCRQLRKYSSVPILFISCKSDDNDIIHGLTVGGDDYITKPFSPSQLVARVKAHLRRLELQRKAMAEGAQEECMLVFDGMIIDLDARSVHIDGRQATLSVKEFDLLTYLAQRPNKAVQIDHLYEVVWGAESNGDTRTLMVHISNLRKKIEPDPANPVYVMTVRGIGYKFATKEGITHVYR